METQPWLLLIGLAHGLGRQLPLDLKEAGLVMVVRLLGIRDHFEACRAAETPNLIAETREFARYHMQDASFIISRTSVQEATMSAGSR